MLPNVNGHYIIDRRTDGDDWTFWNRVLSDLVEP